MSIKQRIRNWLGIEPQKEYITEQFEFKLISKYAQDNREDIRVLGTRLTELERKLKPDLRIRVEQCDSAIQIQTKFLNEIYQELKK
jgi:hypothetical protein